MKVSEFDLSECSEAEAAAFVKRCTNVIDYIKQAFTDHKADVMSAPAATARLLELAGIPVGKGDSELLAWLNKMEDELAKKRSPQHYALPHPDRADLSHVEALTALNFGFLGTAALDVFAKEGIGLAEGVEYIQDHPHLFPEAQMIIRKLREFGTGANLGDLYANLTPIYHKRAGGSTFLFTDSLVKELELSDVGSGVPAEFSIPPLPNMFIRFGESVESAPDLIVNNEVTGEHRLEGCYLHMHSSYEPPIHPSAWNYMGFSDDSNIVSLAIMFIGHAKNGLLDDATHHATIYIDTNSDEDVESQLNKNLDYYSGLSASEEHRDALLKMGHQFMPEHHRDNFRKCCSLLIKALVYLNCADVRREMVDTRTSLEQRIQELTNEKKIRRAKKELELAPRYTLISSNDPTPGLLEMGDTGEKGSKKPHWRRGFFRGQHYGEGNKKIKVVRIKPTLVNKSKLGQGEPAPRNYKVK